MRVAVAVAGAFLLSGCFTFESRFQSGLEDAHAQRSPAWHDPGLYDALPENGTYEGFEVQTHFLTPQPEPPKVPDFPMRIPFEDPGLDREYGAGDYHLAYVRWETGDPSPQHRMVFRLYPDLGVQAIIGREVQDAEKRAAFLEFASMVLDPSEGRLSGAADRFVVYTGGGSSAYMGQRDEGVEGGYHEAMLWGAPLRVSTAFADLGGLSAFAPVRIGQPREHPEVGFGHEVFFLCGEHCDVASSPFHAQIDLVQGNWTFALRVPLRVAAEGPFPDRHALLVAPDDSVMYLHWGASDLSDGEAARSLRRVVDALDRPVPVTDGWTFDRASIGISEGEPDFDLDGAGSRLP